MQGDRMEERWFTQVGRVSDEPSSAMLVIGSTSLLGRSRRRMDTGEKGAEEPGYLKPFLLSQKELSVDNITNLLQS